MQLRKLVLLIGVLSLVLTGQAFALGLGDITLKSSLNQPLEAHVDLLDVGDLSADQIIVNLGSEEDFTRAGLERAFFYSQMRFNVVTNGGRPYLAITSREPVREPFLSFIVEVRWTSGRLLREYTVLLDLPAFAEDGARPVAQAATSSRSTPAKSEPVQQQPQRETAVSATQSTGSSVYGPVKSSDTLWEIALKVRPGNVSVQQTMLAIQRENPEAFINNNINLLRKGQVLRIPSAAEITSVTTRQAISEVATQNRQWSGNAMGAQLDGSSRSGSVSRSTGDVSGRLKLVSGAAGSDSDGAQGGGSGSGAGRALEQELTNTREELERSQSESTELRSRVEELEAQISTMESLLDVSNEQMRALELAAAKGDDSSAADDIALSPSDDSALDEPESYESETTEAAEADAAPVADETVETSAPPVAAEPERQVNKVVRQAPAPSFMDKVMDNIIWVAVGIVVLLLLAVLALRKRPVANDDDALDVEDDFDPDFDMTGEGSSADDADALALDDLDDDAEDDEFPAQAETGDVVGESEIYIALGKYEQAEEMLLRGLEEEPNSEAIQLKLLELYTESDNLPAFDHRYGLLLATAATPIAVARAEDMRKQFVGAPEFDGSNFTPATSEETAFDLDDPGLDGNDDRVDLDDPATDDSFEFDLSLDDKPQTAAADDETDYLLDLEDDASAESDDSFDLDDDFSFDLDDEETDVPQTSESAATSELDLDGASTSYDLSFETKPDEADEGLLDFDLELDDSDETPPVALADTTEKPSDEDDFSFDFELDEPAAAPESESVELDVEDSEADDNAIEFSLDNEDEHIESDLSLDDDEPEALLSEPSEPFGEEDELDLDDHLALPEESVPTLDLADEEADDFDLDQAMDDLDLEALDKEMADLDSDFDLNEPVTAAPESRTEIAAEPLLEMDEDQAFEEALAGVPDNTEDDVLADLPEPEDLDLDDEELDDDLDFLGESDEAATKLDLARAYIDMGDTEGAHDILTEVAEEGNEEQRREAKALLEHVNS